MSLAAQRAQRSPCVWVTILKRMELGFKHGHFKNSRLETIALRLEAIASFA